MGADDRDASIHCCLSCGGTVGLLVDFGMQPPSNRFEQPTATQPERHRLQLGQCGSCALLQLIDPMPPSMAKSRFEWLTYNEPEGHLDRLVERHRLGSLGPGEPPAVSLEEQAHMLVEPVVVHHGAEGCIAAPQPEMKIAFLDGEIGRTSTAGQRQGKASTVKSASLRGS
jgi:hypothetical protein